MVMEASRVDVETYGALDRQKLGVCSIMNEDRKN